MYNNVVFIYTGYQQFYTNIKGFLSFFSTYFYDFKNLSYLLFSFNINDAIVHEMFYNYINLYTYMLVLLPFQYTVFFQLNICQVSSYIFRTRKCLVLLPTWQHNMEYLRKSYEAKPYNFPFHFILWQGKQTAFISLSNIKCSSESLRTSKASIYKGWIQLLEANQQMM